MMNTDDLHELLLPYGFTSFNSVYKLDNKKEPKEVTIYCTRPKPKSSLTINLKTSGKVKAVYSPFTEGETPAIFEHPNIEEIPEGIWTERIIKILIDGQPANRYRPYT